MFLRPEAAEWQDRTLLARVRIWLQEIEDPPSPNPTPEDLRHVGPPQEVYDEFVIMADQPPPPAPACEARSHPSDGMYAAWELIIYGFHCHISHSGHTGSGERWPGGDDHIANREAFAQQLAQINQHSRL